MGGAALWLCETGSIPSRLCLPQLSPLHTLSFYTQGVSQCPLLLTSEPPSAMVKSILSHLVCKAQ